MDSYVSVECPRNEGDRISPIYPFLLWKTNDKKSGDLYMKVDKKSYLVGSFSDQSGVDPVLRAVDLSFKTYWVFNLKYHPYLNSVFSYFETVCNINVNTSSNVMTFIRTLRQIAARK